MKTLTFWKEETEVWIEGNEDGNTETKLQWFCSDGIATFFGDTKAEAASHFGVPVGFDDVSSAASLLGRKGGLAKSERKTTTARENGRKGGAKTILRKACEDSRGQFDVRPGTDIAHRLIGATESTIARYVRKGWLKKVGSGLVLTKAGYDGA
jgi:hypothetical protein